MPSQTFDLQSDQPHSDLSVQVEIRQLGNLSWQLTYQLNDPKQQIFWPEKQSVLSRQDYLWESTCFELFVQAVVSSEYLELNFSPTLQWNAYSFDEYRSPAQMPPRRDDRLRVLSVAVDARQLVAVIDLSECFVAGQALQVGLTCVLKDQAGQCSYWALQHGGQPDFHRASDWLIQLDA
ncbi:MAG: DOMON-like domain-containing protein [Moraxellaceae bacterium]